MNMSLVKQYRHSFIYKLIFALTVLLLLSAAVWMAIIHHLSKELPFTVAMIHVLIGSAVMVWLVLAIVKKPIHRLVDDIQNREAKESLERSGAPANSEIGKITAAISHRQRQLEEKLSKQQDEYQSLFELVPCLITVQDRQFRLLQYNQEFSQQFDPSPGDYCYQVYKGRDQKCEDCPVEKTFMDGQSHTSEEKGFDKDGTPTHWILKTTPVRDDAGDIVAAMEISLDVTHTKQLEELLVEKTKQYHVIFNNIPNPVFVLDCETHRIYDCNDSATAVYGYAKEEFKQQSFLNLFREQERAVISDQLKTSSHINQVAQIGKDQRHIVVNMHIALSEYMGRPAILVTTSDITQRLEAEQQLIQASKMATLGEMATGIAHELNQPLSVIKTGSSFCMKKFQKNETIGDDVILSIISKIDTNTDRATNIIQHMRHLARKSDLTLEPIQLNDVLRSAAEIFHQQLRLRGIDVEWDIQDNLPIVQGDWGRLEQVIINLVLNARDSIEDRWKDVGRSESEKKISLRTRSENERVILEVCDTGIGVPDGLRDKIFEPFFTTKEVGKGTGLGLSISYGFIKNCKGDIQVIPNPDGGACFVITLPKSNSEKI